MRRILSCFVLLGLSVLAQTPPVRLPVVDPPAPAVTAPQDPTVDEKAVVKELSLARTGPQTYAQYLRGLRPYFEGTLWRLPGKTQIRTQEGVAALDEAIAFLEKAKPLGPLRWNVGLFRAAQDQAWFLGPRGRTGHAGNHGLTLQGRLLKRGLPDGAFGELIQFGKDAPRLLVIQLLVDDGVPSRGHRSGIFNPDFHVAGAASCAHTTLESVTVIDLAGGFTGD